MNSDGNHSEWKEGMWLNKKGGYEGELFRKLVEDRGQREAAGGGPIIQPSLNGEC